MFLQKNNLEFCMKTVESCAVVFEDRNKMFF